MEYCVDAVEPRANTVEVADVLADQLHTPAVHGVFQVKQRTTAEVVDHKHP